MTTRETILRSWWAAKRQADATGAVTLTAASFAGHALEAADGNTAVAKSLVPSDPAAFWARTRDALDQVAAEERRHDVADDRADFADEWAREARRTASR